MSRLFAVTVLAFATVANAVDRLAAEDARIEKPYEIRVPDGRVVRAADFLRQKLIDFDRANGRR